MRLIGKIEHKLRVRLARKPSSKIFYWPFQGGASFVDHLCYFCLVFVMLSCASVYLCLVVTCWERADLLALVCDVVTFPLVSWVRCGAWLYRLYRFLIFALFLTLVLFNGAQYLYRQIYEYTSETQLTEGQHKSLSDCAIAYDDLGMRCQHIYASHLNLMDWKTHAYEMSTVNDHMGHMDHMGLVATKSVFRVSDKQDSNRSPQLQGLARKLTFHS